MPNPYLITAAYLRWLAACWAPAQQWRGPFRLRPPPPRSLGMPGKSWPGRAMRTIGGHLCARATPA